MLSSINTTANKQKKRLLSAYFNHWLSIPEAAETYYSNHILSNFLKLTMHVTPSAPDLEQCGIIKPLSWESLQVLNWNVSTKHAQWSHRPPRYLFDRTQCNWVVLSTANKRPIISESGLYFNITRQMSPKLPILFRSVQG